MSKTYKEWLKYYENATKEQVIEDVEHDNLEIERLNKNYDRIYNQNCILREKHNITDVSLLNEVERLNNIIKRLEEDLREMYLTFGEFSEEYTEKKIKELKGSDDE